MQKNTSFKTHTSNSAIEDAYYIKASERPTKAQVAAKRHAKRTGNRLLRRQFKALGTEEPEPVSHRLVLRDEVGKELSIQSAHWTGKQKRKVSMENRKKPNVFEEREIARQNRSALKGLGLCLLLWVLVTLFLLALGSVLS